MSAKRSPPFATPYQRSPLKWAGSKMALLPRLLPLIPAGLRLIEPFMGSGVVTLNVGPRRLLLGDANPQLVNFHRVVRDAPDALTAEAALLFEGGNVRDAFNAHRAEFNALRGAPDQPRASQAARIREAALFLYLNRHGFNGLYRVNSRGVFNVPFGRYDAVRMPAADIAALSLQLSQADLRLTDFEPLLAEAGAGDVVYCDPAYVPLSETARFTRYTSIDFSMADQERLAFFAERAAARGALVIVSNHDTAVSRRLYATASEVVAFDQRRSISRDSANRALAPELFAIYRP